MDSFDHWLSSVIPIRNYLKTNANWDDYLIGTCLAANGAETNLLIFRANVMLWILRWSEPDDWEATDGIKREVALNPYYVWDERYR